MAICPWKATFWTQTEVNVVAAAEAEAAKIETPAAIEVSYRGESGQRNMAS